MLRIDKIVTRFRTLRIDTRKLEIVPISVSSKRLKSVDAHSEETRAMMVDVHNRKGHFDTTLTGVRHKMRGRFNLTKTKWWLEQGPTLLDQVAAINLEYNKPAADIYGFSRGAYNYHNYFIPQLRYKNPNVQIDVNTDQVAVPFMTLYFKDGRNATINCAVSAEEIGRHLQATFCVDDHEQTDKEFDENGRIQNPWMHAKNKPCSTATKYRVHRKCICQQPGQYGCKTALHNTVQMPERRALTKRNVNNLPMEDSWYMNYLMYNEFVGNPRGVLNKYRFYRIRHHDKRPWRGAQAFRNHHDEIRRIEEQQARHLLLKVKGHREFKLIKRLSHKMVHEYWSTWFWQCEPGLGPNMDEVKEQLKLRSLALGRRDRRIGTHEKQIKSRARFPGGQPLYS
jgi:hypothetical protein